MRVVRTPRELHEALRGGPPVALVPTMGALHAGHAHLISEAAAVGRAVVSVFVNPTQFGPQDDFNRYPRQLDADCMVAEGAGAEIVFAPSVETMYPRTDVTVHVSEEGGRWEMARRPGHFSGVATVVLKLFHMAEPEYAFFGWKDLQQCWVVRRMVEDLNVNIRLCFVDTVRESDGLAMSSRNAYLTSAERDLAPSLHRELATLSAEVRSDSSALSRISAASKARLEQAGFDVEYLAWIRLSDLEPAARGSEETAWIVAAKLGTTRLIDNERLCAFE